ncbi:hypothetical protein CZ771_04635 [Actinomycetales bacterium JB111]|nr:hypothetical protein CZ771_04635 [Actinomycetales bacterium JB111]
MAVSRPRAATSSIVAIVRSTPLSAPLVDPSGVAVPLVVAPLVFSAPLAVVSPFT